MLLLEMVDTYDDLMALDSDVVVVVVVVVVAGVNSCCHGLLTWTVSPGSKSVRKTKDFSFINDI
jgi:hypothetical protein